MQEDPGLVGAPMERSLGFSPVQESVLHLGVAQQLPRGLEREEVPVERPHEGVGMLLEGLAELPERLEGGDSRERLPGGG